MNPSLRPDSDTEVCEDEPFEKSGDRELVAGENGASAAVAEHGASAALPERIAGRYRVERVLGRGGMAIVYLCEDGANGRLLALKQLTVAPSHRHYQELAALFEREYHTLVQLSHPRIVEVYDFGVDGRPFYTMELLDGGDLRERAPMPWKEACALIHDVCSTLALLHSRRLVHRDVSPRNVHIARDGSAKLIDFGALAPMGASSQAVGTAPFVPPEVLHRSALDARTDLFSLGATLYFTLTGRLSYPARDFGKLPEAWAARPPAPSAVTPGIPAALDALVMSLIALDPAVRPRSAFEVMQRLSAIAGLSRDESHDVSQAYLSMPTLVGREDALAAFRARIKLVLAAKGGALLLQGPSGIGRSRMLDACAIEGKTAGAAVLRANASLGDRELTLVQSLAAQLVEALPESALVAAREAEVTASLFEPERGDRLRLRDLASAELDRASLQRAMCRWLFAVADRHTLVILVDDLHKADDASLSFLAVLTRAATRKRMLLVATHETGATVRAPEPFSMLRRDSASFSLAALTRAQTEQLFNSVFGDAPHLGLLSDRIFRVAAGNPRESMELAQWLVTKQLVRYEVGSWTLPSKLDLADLPHDLEDAFKQRLATISSAARYLVEALALSVHPTLGHDDFARLAQHGAAHVDELLGELVSQQILASEGARYVLSHRGWGDAARAGLDVEARRERHRALSELYPGDNTRFERAHHLMLGGQEPGGLEVVVETVRAFGDSAGLTSATIMPADQLADVLARALDNAETLPGRPLAEAFELRRALASMSIATDDAYYFRVRPAWFERLRRDSGLAFYEELCDVAQPGERLMQALTRASQVYQSTPEADRVYSPEAAIKGLLYYALVTIAISSRTQASELLLPLPSVLEPFAPLSPIIAAVQKNALATRESNCDSIPERALVHWLEVQDALAKVSVAEMPWVEAVRSAIWYGIGLVEARLGMKVAEERAKLLDEDILQRVSATALRKISRLHQGDFENAERCRKQGEELSLQSTVRQMFSSTVIGELFAYAIAGDLVGLRQCGDTIKPLAARYSGWRPYQYLADGYFEQARGELAAARAAFERGIAESEPDPNYPLRGVGPWPRLEAAYLEVLIALGEAEQAKARGERVLAQCEELAIDMSAFPIRRALALAEAKLGDYAGASARLETVARALVAFGASGLELGATYEARARIAIWVDDSAAIEEYSRLTAKEYRHGERSPLGARYERLMDEARSAGVQVLPQLTDFQTRLTTAFLSNQRSAATIVAERMSRADTKEKRAACALRILCESRSARGGQLYLQHENGLELAAALGDAAPSAAARAFVRRYLADELETADTATVLSKGDELPLLSGSQFLGSDGVAHQPVLLMGDREGEKCCAGIALLAISERTATESNALQVSGAVASYLLLAGDAQPVRVD